jgi:4-amino-4-deoxy-L-arabinose transferase-like glycosyltransferase
MMPPVNLPTPALVTQRAAQRLPRWALVLLCAAYLLPGQFGREPWKNADITAFGYMASIAQGRSPWMAPAIASLPGDGAWLPYWIGALAIKALPFLDPALAARLPFAALLAATLAFVWHSTRHLARTDAAQPAAFAFGGEASPLDYARALADGAVLAVIATLGLLQLGHETTPELVQLSGVALYMWALSASPVRPRAAAACVVAALAVIAASGAPAIGIGLGAAGLLTSQFSRYPGARALRLWLVVGMAAGVLVGAAGHAWAWRVVARANSAWDLVRLSAWFLWPGWLLALWTLWRWRHHLASRHIAVPGTGVAVALVASTSMGASDRALMLAVPGVAVLAAFALPTLKRATGAAIDWFSVFFFTGFALLTWVCYVSLMTGVPAKPAERIARLLPGFEAHFSAIPLAIAALGTVAWLALVRWRTARVQHALWKSLVLPASGVALSWLLVLTLGLPAIDYARSYRPWVALIENDVPPDVCLAAQLPRSALAALEIYARWRLDARLDPAHTPCPYLVVDENRHAPVAAPPGWTLIEHLHRPSERDESTAVFRRENQPAWKPAS